MSTLIVTGGSADTGALQRYLTAWKFTAREFEHVIAVDAGVLVAERLGIAVDYLVGDFDTLGAEELARREHTAGLTVRKYNPQKDDTDTEIAVNLALGMEKGREKAKPERKGFFPEQVVLFGATGTRLDHTLANLFLLARFEEAGISACAVDANNRISVHHAAWVEGSFRH